MTLHRLTSITLGVPDVAASAAFFADFGLTRAPSADEFVRLATRDGGDQVELVDAPTRRLLRLGVGAEHADDLALIAARAGASLLAEIVDSTPELLTLR